MDAGARVSGDCRRAGLYFGRDFPVSGSEFIPRLDEGDLALQIQRLPSVSIKKNQSKRQLRLKSFDGIPEVKTVISKTGRAEVADRPDERWFFGFVCRLEAARWMDDDER